MSRKYQTEIMINDLPIILVQFATHLKSFNRRIFK